MESRFARFQLASDRGPDSSATFARNFAPIVPRQSTAPMKARFPRTPARCETDSSADSLHRCGRFLSNRDSDRQLKSATPAEVRIKSPLAMEIAKANATTRQSRPISLSRGKSEGIIAISDFFSHAITSIAAVQPASESKNFPSTTGEQAGLAMHRARVGLPFLGLVRMIAPTANLQHSRKQSAIRSRQRQAAHLKLDELCPSNFPAPLPNAFPISSQRDIPSYRFHAIARKMRPTECLCLLNSSAGLQSRNYPRQKIRRALWRGWKWICAESRSRPNFHGTLKSFAGMAEIRRHYADNCVRVGIHANSAANHIRVRAE